MSIERAIDGHMMAKVAKLREMGFEDEALNKAALEQVGGNVNLAVQKIISGGMSAPAAPKDEPRGGPAAAGGAASSQKAGSSAVASIFSLPQRASSSVQPSTGGGAQKPRARPTASTSKPARPLVRSVTASGAATGSLGQGLMGMMLPLKRDRDAKMCTAGAAAASGELAAPSRDRWSDGDDVCTVPSDDDDAPGCGSSSTRADLSAAGSASRGASSAAGAGAASLLKRQRVGQDDGAIKDSRPREDTGAPKPGAGGAGSAVPLAERMRPCSWDGFVGQESVRKVVHGLSAQTLPSLILGTPGLRQNLARQAPAENGGGPGGYRREGGGVVSRGAHVGRQCGDGGG